MLFCPLGAKHIIRSIPEEKALQLLFDVSTKPRNVSIPDRGQRLPLLPDTMFFRINQINCTSFVVVTAGLDLFPPGVGLVERCLQPRVFPINLHPIVLQDRPMQRPPFLIKPPLWLTHAIRVLQASQQLELLSCSTSLPVSSEVLLCARVCECESDS